MPNQQVLPYLVDPRPTEEGFLWPESASRPPHLLGFLGSHLGQPVQRTRTTGIIMIALLLGVAVWFVVREQRKVGGR